jgi:hypothetical protein
MFSTLSSFAATALRKDDGSRLLYARKRAMRHDLSFVVQGHDVTKRVLYLFLSFGIGHRGLEVLGRAQNIHFPAKIHIGRYDVNCPAPMPSSLPIPSSISCSSKEKWYRILRPAERQLARLHYFHSRLWRHSTGLLLIVVLRPPLPICNFASSAIAWCRNRSF